MNIQAINYFNFPNLKAQNTNDNSSQNTKLFGLKMQGPLTHDVVSFGNKKITNLDEKRLKRLGATFLDVLEAISIRHPEINFNRTECEKHIIKTPASFISKKIRTPDGNVLDRIRATVTTPNIYDMDELFKTILPELNLRGFVPKPMTIKSIDGKPVEVEDISIRLIKDEIKNLPTEYKYAYDGPQKSGYEDIQIHLVRDFDPKKEPVPHELIISMGENYLNAKDIEHKMIYEKTRKFNELGILKAFDSGDENFVQSAKRYVDLITKFFRDNASVKLFENAKNKDLYGIDVEEVIKFREADINVYENYFERLQGVVTAYYKGLMEKYPSQKYSYMASLKNDRNCIDNIKKELDESIKTFNKKANSKAKATTKEK